MTDHALLDLDGLASLIEQLKADGFDVIGPTVRDGAIVPDRIAGVSELPAGWGDEQSPGHYRLVRREADPRVFAHVVGPGSPKRWLLPPRVTLWEARRETAGGFSIDAPAASPRPLALIGVRDCEVRAIAIQDRVLIGGEHVDIDYAARRAGLFVVAVGCTDPASTCFCTSMGGGPDPRAGYDLALTELMGSGGHRFVVRTGSPAGAALLARLPHRPATTTDIAAAGAALEDAASRITRTLDSDDLPARLQAAHDHPHWMAVAERCLACANCTMVCPTCFCTAVEDRTSLDGQHAERDRRWDSCFSLAYSHTAGGSTRRSVGARYRQWLTHKLSTWQDQFDTSGCVGCGRCITWCPVGIDITAEATAVAGGGPLG